jgi:predicted transcriptional regulator
MSKKVHRGEILKAAIYESHISIVKIAKLVKFSRRKIYLDFENENVSDDDLLKYGNVIGVDFSRQIPSLLESSIIREAQAEYVVQNKYQAKYYDLLEKHVAAVEELNILRKKIAPSEPSESKVRQTRKKK